MKKDAPTLRRHRRSGHGYARFDGRQVWFGPYDDPETHEHFARTLAEWIAHGRRLPPEDPRKNLRVADVAAAYLEFATRFYSGTDGKPTREVEHIRTSVKVLLKLYGGLRANDFGLRQAKTLREEMIQAGLSRKTINDRVNRVVRLFGWAAEEELCQAEVYGALRALRSLKRGRSAAKEGKRVLPVSWIQVEATLPHVTRPMAGMIELMWHTGMRPGEACRLRPADLDRSGPVWFYRPQRHKTEHFGRERLIAIGPRGQEVLKRFLTRVPAPAPDAPLFSPRDAMAEFHGARRKARKTDHPPGMWTPREGAEMLLARKCPWRSPDGSTARSSSVRRCS